MAFSQHELSLKDGAQVFCFFINETHLTIAVYIKESFACYKLFKKLW